MELPRLGRVRGRDFDVDAGGVLAHGRHTRVVREPVLVVAVRIDRTGTHGREHASGSRIARVRRARVVVVAHDRRVGDPTLRRACVRRARVRVVRRYRAGLAGTAGAGIRRAHVAVRTRIGVVVHERTRSRRGIARVVRTRIRVVAAHRRS